MKAHGALLAVLLSLCLWDMARGQTIVSIEEESYSGREDMPLEVCVLVEQGSLTEDLDVELSIQLNPPFSFTLTLSVTLTPTRTTDCGTFNFIDDSSDLGTQSLTIVASISSSAATLGRSTAPLTLIDDDAPVVMCPELTAPTNGQLSITTRDVGGMVNYSCNSPFTLVGNAERTCQSSGNWTGDDPVCLLNQAVISFQEESYTVRENSSVQVCIIIVSGFIGESFFAWLHYYLPGFGSVSEFIEITPGWSVGETYCGEIFIDNDDVFTGNRNVELSLEIPANVSGVEIGQNTSNLYIVDNDVVISFEEPRYTVMEGSSTEVCIIIDNGTVYDGFCVWVRYHLSGFAYDRVKFSFFEGQTAGNTSCEDITITGDDVFTGNMNVSLEIEVHDNVSNVIANRNESVIYVIDDEGPPVDECFLNLDNCSMNAICTDTNSSFTCECFEGFIGDGVTCEDIDECESDPCDDNADCDNTPGSFTCECNFGYSGDGFTCADIDECLSQPCDMNADCNNTGGSFECVCFIGYTGDGFTCADIDECESDPCDDNADCDNTNGSFTCECNDGYDGDGFTCEDIDECATDQDNCDENANCTNTDGGFTCECNDGFIGDGVVCVDDLVQLTIDPDRYSVIEGGMFEVCLIVYNPSPVDLTVTATVEIPDLGLSATVTIEAPANTSFKFTLPAFQAPDDQFLNDQAQREEEIELSSDDALVAIPDGGGVGTLVIVDNDIVVVGFEETEYTFLEDEGAAHVCVELVRGSRCRRPVVLRVHTRVCDQGYPADEEDDFTPVWLILSVDINSEQGDLTCFYVPIIDDSEIEFNETFKVYIEIYDINAYVPAERQTAVITIIDDDNVTCPQLDITNGTVMTTGFRPGAMATYSCDEFFSLSGDANRTCTEDGEWTGEDPECERDPLNVTCVYELVSFEGPLNVNCSADGPLPIDTILCQFDDEMAEVCSFPLVVDFLEFDAGDHTLTVTFNDTAGIEGSDSVDFFAPAICPVLMIDNGTVTISGQAQGSTANYTCDPFYTLNGVEMRTCTENGTWTGEDPECVRDPISVMCTNSSDFESASFNCSAVGPFPIVETICDFDDGAIVEMCPDGPDLDFDRFAPGQHTLVITFVDSDGVNASSPLFSFFVPPPLDLNCTAVRVTALMFTFYCVANNNATLTCDLTNLDSGATSNVSCALDVNVTISDLDPSTNYSLLISAVDEFQGVASEVLNFTTEILPDLMLQFNDNTPEVTGNMVRLSFEANLPLENGTCSAGGNSMSCTIDGRTGSAMLSVGSSVFPRTISITVFTRFNQQATITRSVRSEATGQCSNHLINEGVVVDVASNEVRIDIQIIGPNPDNRVTASRCTLDGTTMTCPDPLVYPADSGDHRLVIRPIDPDGRCSREQGLVVNYVVP